MKTRLKIGKKNIQGVPLEAASKYPAMRDTIDPVVNAELGEYEELFLGYGTIPFPLPYTMQDCYDGKKEQLEFDLFTLENSFLRAEFTPALGGRLWSLFDKKNNRELLLNNSEFLPGNLATRNAWFSTGVEFNFARVGHDAQTCSPRFAAVLQDKSDNDVLRIYEYSRDRNAVFQLDFSLPENSQVLYTRVRITNPNDTVIPMYYWANMALPEISGSRVIVPADSTYTSSYNQEGGVYGKIPLPDGEGVDSTYPHNFWNAKDHFYNIPQTSRKYMALVHPDGNAFMHCSSRRLIGRKLFVWGQSQGGKHWQRKLMGEDRPDYIELQAGLCKTQMECLPMPPNTTWEWLETYGATKLEKAKVFNDWHSAVNHVTVILDVVLPERELDQMLEETRETAVTPGKLIFQGSGWGALENLRRKEANLSPLPQHLDFGSPGLEQRDWVELLKKGVFPEKQTAPSGYMVQPEWMNLLKKVPDASWQKHLHLGLYYYSILNFPESERWLRKSIRLNRNSMNLYVLSYVFAVQNKLHQAATTIFAATKLDPDNPSLCKNAMKIMLKARQYQQIIRFYRKQSISVQQRPLCRYLYAEALAHTNHLQEAEELILQDGGLELPDIREGAYSISELYIKIQEHKLEESGMPLPPEKISVPFKLDLRMVDPNRKNG